MNKNSKTRLITHGNNDLDLDFVSSCEGLKYDKAKIYEDSVTFAVSDGTSSLYGKLNGERDLLGESPLVKASFKFEDNNCIAHSFQKHFDELPILKLGLIRKFLKTIKVK